MVHNVTQDDLESTLNGLAEEGYDVEFHRVSDEKTDSDGDGLIPTTAADDDEEDDDESKKTVKYHIFGVKKVCACNPNRDKKERKGLPSYSLN